MNDVRVTRLDFRNTGIYRTYFNNVRRLCIGMRGLLAQIKRQPPADLREMLHKYYNIRVNRFIPLSVELQSLSESSVTVPRDILRSMYGIDRALNIQIEKLEKQLGLK